MIINFFTNFILAFILVICLFYFFEITHRDARAVLLSAWHTGRIFLDIEFMEVTDDNIQYLCWTVIAMHLLFMVVSAVKLYIENSKILYILNNTINCFSLLFQTSLFIMLLLSRPTESIATVVIFELVILETITILVYEGLKPFCFEIDEKYWKLLIAIK